MIPTASADRFVLSQPYEPRYLATLRSGRMAERVEQALAELSPCYACPRDCGIDRLANETKVCNTGRHAIVSSAYPHFGEELGLRGRDGSGAIFFGLCNLRCVFCQNWQISQRQQGWEADAEELCATMLDLQARGCHNINFVTPEHVAPQVVEAIALAAARGLRIPIVYNTSGYDALRSLRLLDGLVDIYLPDFKFWSGASAKQLAKAKDYPQRAREAIAEMYRQVGPLRFDRRGLAQTGVLLRHLVMPGGAEEGKAIMDWVAQQLSTDTYVNLMGQYRPDYEVGAVTRKGPRYLPINRRPHHDELEEVRRSAEAAGLWRFEPN